MSNKELPTNNPFLNPDSVGRFNSQLYRRPEWGANSYEHNIEGMRQEVAAYSQSRVRAAIARHTDMLTQIESAIRIAEHKIASSDNSLEQRVTTLPNAQNELAMLNHRKWFSSYYLDLLRERLSQKKQGSKSAGRDREPLLDAIAGKVQALAKDGVTNYKDVCTALDRIGCPTHVPWQREGCPKKWEDALGIEKYSSRMSDFFYKMRKRKLAKID